VHLTPPLAGGSVAPLAIFGRSGGGGGGRGLLLLCRGNGWGGARGTFSLAEAMGVLRTDVLFSLAWLGFYSELVNQSSSSFSFLFSDDLSSPSCDHVCAFFRQKCPASERFVCFLVV